MLIGASYRKKASSKFEDSIHITFKADNILLENYYTSIEQINSELYYHRLSIGIFAYHIETKEYVYTGFSVSSDAGSRPLVCPVPYRNKIEFDVTMDYITVLEYVG